MTITCREPARRCSDSTAAPIRPQSLRGGPRRAATGGVSCTAGVDYVNNSGTLNFAAGDTSKTFSITLCDDSTFETDETVNLSLSTVTGDAILGSPNTATLTINDNDTAPAFSIDDVSHMEGNSGTTEYIFTITKSGATAFNAT